MDPLYKIERESFGPYAAPALLTFLLWIVASAWASTQLFAWWLQYPQALGPPWLVLEGEAASLASVGGGALLGLGLLLGFLHRPVAFLFFGAPGIALVVASHEPVYAPFQVVEWFRWFGGVPELGHVWKALAGLFGTSVVVGLVRLVVYLQAFEGGDGAAHGSSRWATTKDLEAAQFFNETGPILGLWEGKRYLRGLPETNILVQGPPGSGKGVGCVLPTLLTWGGSLVVHDPKGELWHQTAAFRKTLGPALRFDPTDASDSCSRLNALFEIDPARDVEDSQRLAMTLVGDAEAGESIHFRESAINLLQCAILHLLYSRGLEKSLPAIERLVCDPSRALEEVLTEMLEAEHDPRFEFGWTDARGRTTKTHPVVATTARLLLSLDSRERGSVLSTLTRALAIFRSWTVIENVSTSDFRLRDLVHGDRPVSLYITVPTSEMDRVRPLVRLLLEQMLQEVTRELRFEDGRARPTGQHDLLFVLDEFPVLGRMPFLQKSLGVLRGYGVQVLLVVQSFTQLGPIYHRKDEAESLLASCHTLVSYGAGDERTPRLVAQLAGKQTVRQKHTSHRGGLFEGLAGGSVTVSSKDHGRDLIAADEVRTLPKDQVLLFSKSVPPIRAHWPVTYEDKTLGAWMRIPPPAQADRLAREPVLWEGI